MLRPSDNLFRLVPHFDMNNVGLATFRVNDSNSSVVASMGHAFVDRRINQYSDFLSGLIGSEDSAQSNLTSFARFLAEEASCPGSVPL